MTCYELLAAFCIDMLLGDPHGWPHPVIAIGWLIGRLEKSFNKLLAGKILKKIAGILILILVVGLPSLITFFMLRYTTGFLHSAIVIYISYSAMAAKSLADAAKRVWSPLNNSDLKGAKDSLAMIVGRDTASLSEDDILKALIETLSENLSDGMIAPLFYLAVGGPVAAIAYKCVNTLDSMIGYRTERFIDIGWASARMDDLLNLIPARLTGLFISLSFLFINGFTLKGFALKSFYVMLRDGAKSCSPNAGYPESAMAGGLGIELGGSDIYQGEIRNRPIIGKGGRMPVAGDVKTVIGVVFFSSALMTFISGLRLFFRVG